MAALQARILFIIVFVFLPALTYPQAIPDYGTDGLAGLSVEQKQRLAQGKIIRPESMVKTPEGKTLIEAALIFDKPPEEVWRLLSKTEDQVTYLDEVKKVAVVSKSSTEDNLELTLKVLVKTVVYRQIHYFDEKNLCIRWTLDPHFKSDLKEVNGFWRFYPYGSGKTLARYGSRVKLRFRVPDFIQTALIKKNMPRALQSVKKYVNSGGTWVKKKAKSS
jgi:uncharacterized membrane protein